jgi:hypothetical protein
MFVLSLTRMCGLRVVLASGTVATSNGRQSRNWELYNDIYCRNWEKTSNWSNITGNFIHIRKKCLQNKNILFNLMFCWPCIIVYQYSKTNVMLFLFNLLRIMGLYVFQALLAHPQKVLTSGTWYIASVLCQLAATRVRVERSYTPNLVAAN